MHLDEHIEVAYPINVAKQGGRKRLARRVRLGGPMESGSWREGAPERRSRPRRPQGDVAQPVRTRAETGSRSDGHRASDRKALSRWDAAIAYIRCTTNIKFRVVGVAALLGLALLSYGLLVLSPQQVASLTVMSFTLPAVAAAASGVTHPPKPVERSASDRAGR